MKKYIRKEYVSLTQAEKFLNRLYNKHDYVKLVTCPLFSEKGIYVYEVK